MSDEIALLSAIELLRLYRTKRLSPVEAARAALDRIAKVNSVLTLTVFSTNENVGVGAVGTLFDSCTSGG